MAGFRVLWANEANKEAQRTYRLNHPTSVLDPRDVRKVKPEDVLQATGLKPGQLDLFDGSPPCTAFSTAGKRHKGWGEVNEHQGLVQRVDDLFFEYIRLLRGLQPRTFVAENVSGLVKGTCKGYFLEILKEFKASGYVVEARLLDAQWLGVPQMRQRIIFVGVRQDLSVLPAFPKPLSYRYSVRDACPWIGRAVEDTGGQWGAGDITDRPGPNDRAGAAGHLQVEHETLLPPSRLRPDAFNTSVVRLDAPCQTVTVASPGNDLAVPGKDGRRRFTISELKRICGFPDDFQLTGSYAQQWMRLGNCVPPVMMYYISSAVRDGILSKLNQ